MTLHHPYHEFHSTGAVLSDLPSLINLVNEMISDGELIKL